MTKIKICGLSRPCDIDYVNEARPDFCGFVLGAPKSPRNITVPLLRELRSRLDGSITPVGIFVNDPLELILPLAKEQVLGAIQLHGLESPSYIQALKREISIPVIKAFRVDGAECLREAEESPADLILLDNGTGGTGSSFDWSLLKNFNRPYILAGGLGPENLETAIKTLHPWGVDMSSGVESGGFKDKEKILAAAAAVRRCTS